MAEFSSLKMNRNNRRWKSKLEKANFSHIKGEKPICTECGLQPRFSSEDDPSQVHAELCPDCKYVKDNLVGTESGSEEEGEFLATVEDAQLTTNEEKNITKQTGAEKYPVQVSDGGEIYGKRSKPSYVDRSTEVLEKTHCRSCQECLKDLEVVVNYPCGHKQCKECAFEQQKKCCDTPITNQYEGFWS